MLRPSSVMFAAPANQFERLHRVEACIEFGGSRLGREEQRRGDKHQHTVSGYNRHALELRTD